LSGTTFARKRAAAEALNAFMNRFLCLPVFLVLAFGASPILAQKASAKAKKAAPKGPPPTMANVPYGKEERQVLDFYQAASDKPTPLVFFIHGGGWRAGDKDRAVTFGLDDFLKAGISVAAINYRFVSAAQQAGVNPPVKWPLEDAARALQFVRSKAGEWKIDKARIGATGGSAGAASSLWLLYHDDLADAASSDPVARESTRLMCAGVVGAQTCFDPHLLREWLPNMLYGGHAFGFTKEGQSREQEFQAFYDGREKVMAWVNEYSPYHLVTKDDPPVFLQYSGIAAEPPVVGKPAKDPTHSAVLGIKLVEKLKEVGVEGHVVYPGGPAAPHATAVAFLIATLKKP
jgi:hypothetical protein